MGEYAWSDREDHGRREADRESMAGCLLRVSSEPLAYEGFLSAAWKVLPISGMLELSAVLLFATNLALTLMLGDSVFAGDSPREPIVA